jgi:hypothetical protein
MAMQKIIILAINLIGGAAVIGSYIFGLANKTNGANALWGGTSASIKPIYTISMFLAALGYFFFIYFILFKLSPAGFNFNILYLIFFGILGASIFWMPLSNAFVSHPSAGLWLAIRFILAIVGFSSIALAWVLISMKGTGLAYNLAVAGSIYFTFHTAILDAILWPIFFKMQ